MHTMVVLLSAMTVQEPAARQTTGNQVDVRIGTLPSPFVGSDGLRHLAYELNVTATGAGDGRIERLDATATPAFLSGTRSTSLVSMRTAARRAATSANHRTPTGPDSGRRFWPSPMASFMRRATGSPTINP